MKFGRTHGNRSRITQGALPIHIKFSCAFDDVNLFDELLVGANEGGIALTGEFSIGSEVDLGAGSDLPPVTGPRVVTVVV